MVITSCNKSDPPETATESKFTWVYEGTTFVAKQHTAKLTGIGGPSISAGVQEGISAGSGPRISLTSFEKGTYSISSGSVTYFDYIDMAGSPLAGNTELSQ
ncbi:MAG TPA: hypothetical protein VGN63_01995 [Flavisolibacter sp.]|jgi:uridine phosphorylase|nr:hypothetical protein [Flavisolibacter sp.]